MASSSKFSIPRRIASIVTGKGTTVDLFCKFRDFEKVERLLTTDYLFNYKITGASFAQAFKDSCVGLFEWIVETSPKDTGAYEKAWSKKISNQIKTKGKIKCTIKNNVRNKYQQNYGIFLIHGTDKFKRSESRNLYAKTDPQRGILHDVRSMVWEWQFRMGTEIRARWGK